MVRKVSTDLLKLAGAALLLYFANYCYSDTFVQQAGAFQAADKKLALAVYVAVFAMGVLSFVTAPFYRNVYLRVAVVGVLLAGYGFNQVYRTLSMRDIDIGALGVLWVNRSMHAEVLAGYAGVITPILALLAPVAIILLLAPRVVRLPAVVAVLPIATVVANVAIIAATQRSTSDFFPPTAIPAYMAFINSSHRAEAAAQQPVPVARKQSPLASKIVLVVDESVRGDYLQINRAPYANTPYLDANAHRYVNFGIATSAFNGSTPSRNVLRFGHRFEDIRAIDRQAIVIRPKGADIWDYARQAGMKTVMIDAWRDKFCCMSEQEVAKIDVYVPVVSNDLPNRDRMIVDELARQLKEPGPAFIYVTKYGVHYPYQASYPRDFQKFAAPPFTVDLAKFFEPRANYAKLMQGAGFTETERRDLIGAYNNAVSWSVDGFFERMSPIRLDDALIVYVSDHGQSLGDGPYRLTHGSGDSGTVAGEGVIPMLAFTDNAGLRSRLEMSLPANLDRMSHFEVFPSLLTAFGYDPDWVRSAHGSHMWGPVQRWDRAFFDGRGGLHSVDGTGWKAIGDVSRTDGSRETSIKPSTRVR